MRLIHSVFALGDECGAGDDFFADLAVALSAQINTSSSELTELQEAIDTAEEMLADIQKMRDAVSDAASAIEFANAVAALENEAEAASLSTLVNVLYAKAQDYVSTATLLVEQSSDAMEPERSVRPNASASLASVAGIAVLRGALDAILVGSTALFCKK